MVFPHIDENDTADDIASKTEAFEQQMEQLESQGKAKKVKQGFDIEYGINKADIAEHAIIVKRNGKDVLIYIQGNPRAAQAVNGKLKDATGSWNWGWYDTFKRYYSAIMTNLNLNFSGANIARDAQHALLMTYIEQGVAETGKFAVNVKDTFPALLRGIAGKGDPSNNQFDKYFEEFIENGGETGYSMLNSVEDWKINNRKRWGRKSAGEKVITSPKQLIKFLRDSLDTLNRVLENSTRFNAYCSAREQGKSIVDSIKAAKDITVNFNKKGAVATKGVWGIAANIYRKWRVFANPIIQGLYQVGRAAKNHPARFTAVTTGLTTWGLIVPMLNELLISALGGDDDEDDYYNLNDYTRRNNLCIFVGDGYVKIPLPPFFRTFYAVGDIIYMAMDDQLDADEVAYELISEIRAMLSIEGQQGYGDEDWSMLRFLMPDPGSAFVDIEQNVNFTGAPIYKEDRYANDEYEPEYQRVYRETWEPLVGASKIMNEVLGGNEYVASEKSNTKWINPGVWQHLITSYTGGIGQLVGDVATLTTNLVNDENEQEFSWYNVPVAKRFYTEPDERTMNAAIRRRFYKVEDEMKRYGEEMTGMGKDTVNDLSILRKLTEMQQTPKYKFYNEEYKDGVKEINQLRRKKKKAATKEAEMEYDNKIAQIQKELTEQYKELTED